MLDGKLDEQLWTDVGYSDDFVDISTNVVPRFRTNMKIRFDDSFIYVGARIEEPDVWANITHTCHCVDPLHDQVIYHDNDYEVCVLCRV